MYIYFMCQTFKYQFRSYINKFNFFEVQNIHQKNKRNFHIKISEKSMSIYWDYKTLF